MSALPTVIQICISQAASTTQSGMCQGQIYTITQGKNAGTATNLQKIPQTRFCPYLRS